MDGRPSGAFPDGKVIFDSETVLDGDQYDYGYKPEQESRERRTGNGFSRPERRERWTALLDAGSGRNAAHRSCV